MSSQADNPFGGKIIEVISKCAPGLSEFLEAAKLQAVAGVTFLVGTDVQEASYRKGLEVWIAMDDIAQIAIFDNADDMESRLRARRKDNEEEFELDEPF